MFAYNKNYHQIKSASPDDIRAGDSVDDVIVEEVKTFTYEILIRLVLEFAEENAQQVLEAIAMWKLLSNENFLISCLKNR